MNRYPNVWKRYPRHPPHHRLPTPPASVNSYDMHHSRDEVTYLMLGFLLAVLRRCAWLRPHVAVEGAWVVDEEKGELKDKRADVVGVNVYSPPTLSDKYREKVAGRASSTPVPRSRQICQSFLVQVHLRWEKTTSETLRRGLVGREGTEICNFSGGGYCPHNHEDVA